MLGWLSMQYSCEVSKHDVLPLQSQDHAARGPKERSIDQQEPFEICTREAQELVQKLGM